MTSKYVLRVYDRWKRRLAWKQIGNACCNFYVVIPLIIVIIVTYIFEQLAYFLDWCTGFLESKIRFFEIFKVDKPVLVAQRQMRRVYVKAKKREDEEKDEG